MVPELPRGTFVGLTTLDVVQRVSRPPGINEKVTALRQDVAAGGPAANAAVVFAALGGRARLVTALGRSSGADLVRSDLEQHGVEIVDLTPGREDGPSISSITVVDGTATVRWCRPMRGRRSCRRRTTSADCSAMPRWC